MTAVIDGPPTTRQYSRATQGEFIDARPTSARPDHTRALVFIRLASLQSAGQLVAWPPDVLDTALRHLAPRADAIEAIGNVVALVFHECRSFGEAVSRAESALNPLVDSFGFTTHDVQVVLDVRMDERDTTRGLRDIVASLPAPSVPQLRVPVPTSSSATARVPST